MNPFRQKKRPATASEGNNHRLPVSPTSSESRPMSAREGGGRFVKFWHSEDKRDIINIEKCAEADIVQCAKDWHRDRKITRVNGVSLDLLFSEAGIKALPTDKKSVEATSSVLREFWRTHLLSDFNKDKQIVMLDYMSNFMHQGGVMHALQTELCESAAVEKSVSITQGNIESHVDISSDRNNEIYILESFDVKAVFVDDPEITKDEFVSVNDNQVVSKKDGGPLLSCFGMYVLSIDEQNKVKCTVKSVNFEYHCEYARSLCTDLVSYKKEEGSFKCKTPM